MAWLLGTWPGNVHGGPATNYIKCSRILKGN